MQIDEDIKILNELDKLRNNAHTAYCSKFEEIANKIKDDVINKVKSLIPNVVDHSFSVDYDPESGSPDMCFYFVLKGESEFMIEDDDKYWDILLKDEFIMKLVNELKSSFHIGFRGTRKGEINGRKISLIRADKE